jgi:hypothetical protein
MASLSVGTQLSEKNISYAWLTTENSVSPGLPILIWRVEKNKLETCRSMFVQPHFKTLREIDLPPPAPCVDAIALVR